MAQSLEVLLWRGGADGRYQAYEVPLRESQTVLDEEFDRLDRIGVHRDVGPVFHCEVRIGAAVEKQPYHRHVRPRRPGALRCAHQWRGAFTE